MRNMNGKQWPHEEKTKATEQVWVWDRASCDY